MSLILSYSIKCIDTFVGYNCRGVRTFACAKVKTHHLCWHPFILDCHALCMENRQTKVTFQVKTIKLHGEVTKILGV